MVVNVVMRMARVAMARARVLGSVMLERVHMKKEKQEKKGR
jgi:hypothetical protein